MDSLWGELKEIGQENKPEDLIKSQFDILQEQTEGAVIGRVEKFDKSVDELLSSTTTAALESMQTMMTPQAQSYLGETKDVSGLTFEVYLAARKIPNYKYRFMFVQHGVSPYPTKIVIEKAIAEQVGMDRTVFKCDSEEEFIQSLKLVLSSDRVMTIVSRLNSYR